MAGLSVDAVPGEVGVMATSGRGHTPEEVAGLCVNRIISVSSQANPAIRDQAEAYKNVIEKVIVHYMKQAVKSDRTTVYNELCRAGHKDLAEAIWRM